MNDVLKATEVRHQMQIKRLLSNVKIISMVSHLRCSRKGDLAAATPLQCVFVWPSWCACAFVHSRVSQFLTTAIHLVLLKELINGLLNYSPRAKASLQLFFANKVLLECSHAHFF